MTIEIRILDYKNSDETQHLIDLLDHYARDEMGGGVPLSEKVRKNLASELSALPHAFSIIAYVDDKPAGLANCFEVFSTFQCKPIINIHDVIVKADFRGLKLSTKILEKVQSIAVKRGCCKITLEVLEGNYIAQNAYKKFGFSGYELDPKVGRALFWEKALP
ncbi:GNAT family N-acetyltransferase [Temperatibacter marinus]|uniref:GNAT family N-acetyltransferase n=1 Tax=Temperatibacter marinus TaxID=1456591 RepID=A0AA52EIY3_9PROT|nr:GNAT family N-acetyltransferase [Temperatibacter marinus]WND04008.1 GNAT family N-acetyltransferase [Temperatibacter marinus]